MTEDPQNPPEKSASPPSVSPMRAWHYLILLVPYAALLVPSLYARTYPEILGIPFFYAYQFAWVFLTAGLTALVYLSLNR